MLDYSHKKLLKILLPTVILLLIIGCNAAQESIVTASDSTATSSQAVLPTHQPASVITPETNQSVHSSPQDFVPEGMHLYATAVGDLNGDGLEDAAIVFGPAVSEDKKSPGKWEPRTLALLIRDSSGALMQVKASNKLIPCPNCGGTMGDPFSSLKIADSSFTVLLQGGSREQWSEQYTFTHSSQQQDWLLTRMESRTGDNITGNSKSDNSIPAAIENIPFESFNREQIQAEMI